MQQGYILIIDGDNVNCSYLSSFTKYIEDHFGHILEIHLVGKLNSSYLDDWNQTLKSNPNMFAHTVEENDKNSTDIKMAFIAFQKYFAEEAYRNFVILSSDSDMISVSAGLPSDVNLIIGYSKRKASPKYLADLDKRGITRIDIDSVRGELSEADLCAIVNKTMETYISFKLSDKFFSYATVQEWLEDRYPGIDSINAANIHKYCKDLTIQFTPSGISIKKT